MLRRRGIIDAVAERLAEQRKASIVELLKVFARSRSAGTSKHVKLVLARIRRIVTGCAFATIGDIAAEPVQEFLQRVAAEEDLGPRTYHHFLQAIDTFCKWLVAKKRLSATRWLA